ncbi:MAG TPA: 3'(2'),5'-bisphosphate nucleotidase CysQ [Pseudonocardiaceae bacterium]|jgi:3'(2'), 5'-bisphosphate nucleotidase|nr:3'(2'),5'-bisphosphate nucleotidase CysQ [Pseudonocardiaceae bacterium]
MSQRTDPRLAAELAEQAGQLLLELRAAHPADGDGAELGRRGDSLANEFLLRRLAEERPDDAVLSEEAVDDPARLVADRVWIVDPLDGTREFSVPGRADWAVHVALCEPGRGITAAAVAQPVIGRVHASDDPPPATGGAPGRRPRLAVSRSRPAAFITDLAADLDAELVPMGSAGVKAMAVLRGEVDAYVHAGGQWEWDSAAPVGVVLAAGLHASRLDGTPLTYNAPHPYLPDLVICRPELAGPLLAALGRHFG